METAFSKPYQDLPGPMTLAHLTTFRFLRHPHHCTDPINGWPSILISSEFACNNVIHNTCKKYDNLVQPCGKHCLIMTFLSCNHTLSNVLKYTTEKLQYVIYMSAIVNPYIYQVLICLYTFTDTHQFVNKLNRCTANLAFYKSKLPVSLHWIPVFVCLLTDWAVSANLPREQVIKSTANIIRLFCK